jgi:hypothetical protein
MENTPQELGRTDADDTDASNRDQDIDRAPEENVNADSSHRTEAWIDAFHAQLSEDLADRVIAFARPRAFYVGCAGRKVDDNYARELVQDAVGDTWIGRLRWDPDRVSLKTHLMRAVQCRSKDAHNQAKALPHDSLGDGTDRSLAAESEASSEVAGSSLHAEVVTYLRESVAQLRAAASDDKHVLRVIDAVCAGAGTKLEILEHARMNARTYVNALVRLRKIIRKRAAEQAAPKARA